MKKEAGSSFDLWGIFLQTYLHSYKNKGLEQRHRIVTTIQSNGHYTISLVRINHCIRHKLLSILMVSVFPFRWLSWSCIKIIDNHCSKSLTINPVFLSSLYRIVIGIICIMKVFKEVKHVAYENFEQQRP